MWLIYSLIILLPLVSPFGVQASFPISLRDPLATPPPPSKAQIRSRISMHETLDVDDITINENNRSTLPAINENSKGEHQVNFLSKIFYFYVSPLLKLSASRQLEVTDALPTDEKVSMEHQVPRLEKIYSRCREKARNHLERLRAGNPKKRKGLKEALNGKIAESESLILAKALILHQRRNIIVTGILRLFNTAVQAFPALLVARLLRLIEAGDVHPSEPVRAAIDLVMLLSLKMVIENQYFHNVVKCSTMVRGSLSGLLFDKSLKVSSNMDHSKPSVSKGNGIEENENGSKKDQQGSKSTSRNVLNLMQSDVSIIESSALQIHTIWDGLLQITIYSTLLYKYLGPSVIWGIAVLLLTIPTNAITLRILNKLSKLESEAKDERTRKTNEAITNMKLLKLFGWDNYFEKGIERQRKEELCRHVNRGAFRALNNAISNAVPSIVLVVTLTAYRKTGRPIVASTIFTAISLFNQLRFPLLFYPMVIDSLANGKNALKRLSSYLCQEDLTEYVQRLPKSTNEGGELVMENGNFLWSKPLDSGSDENSFVARPALCGGDLRVKPGWITAVVGDVGSGKSALVKALLGELEPVPQIVVNDDIILDSQGTSVNKFPTVIVKGDVAYCPQEAWLSNGSLKDAVLFGREFDKERYCAAIYDAGLDYDISSGSLSHDTQVGEGGSSLSGGQRARVQLARALYDDNVGVYILDDPLSALDPSVGSMVFERIVKRIRTKKIAVIFVTNDISLPRRCDNVILMGKKKSQSTSVTSCSHIVDQGSYDELISRGHDLRSISFHSNATVTEDTQSNNKNRRGKGLIKIEKPEEITKTLIRAENETIMAPLNIEIDTSESCQLIDEEAIDKAGEGLTIDDQMTTSAVPWSTYLNYFKSVRNPPLVALALLCFLLANGAQFFQQFVVAKWTEIGNASAMSAALGTKYLQSLVYAAGVVSVFLWLRTYLLMRVGTRASQYIHSKMLKSIFSAPVSFFDKTPSGQLLSRFGKELEIVDRGVPDGIGSVLFCVLNIVMTGAGLAGLMTVGMILPLSFISIFYLNVMSKFRPVARDLKRIETKTRSPIYTHFTEALKGAETIRSFKSSPTLWRLKLRDLVDTNLSVFYSVKAMDRWLSVRLETLGNVVVLAAAFASVFLTRAGKMKAGAAGWGLTQSLAITGLLTWAVRVVTDLETQMMSVMRVNELTNMHQYNGTENSLMVPQEKAKPGEALDALYYSKLFIPSSPMSEKGLTSTGWPWSGEISMKNVSVRYSPSSQRALKNINIHIPSGTTLGVVGRTGSGKSSLLLTLFRLMEIDSGGSIEIDGVDIRSISLDTLREAIAIIPQDPVLFQGTLYFNLDATGKASESEAWDALRAASPDLANQFQKSQDGLYSTIKEGGKNLSAGQRQLICLARALLRKSKILVLDEATSSVDPKTDALVQETIRRQFVEKGVSVITVAHRLDTVLGSDKIAVLGEGKLLEFGSPNELLRKHNGHFYKLVDAYNKNKRKGAQQRSIVSFSFYDGNDVENSFFSEDNEEDDDADFDTYLQEEFEKFKQSRDDFQFIFEIDEDLKPTKAHIILFNPGTDREGVHTIEFPKGSGNNLILAFESRTECEKFSALLKDQNFFDPSPQEMDLESLEEYCDQIGVKVQVIPKGMHIAPPEETTDNLGLNPDLEKEMAMLDYLFHLSTASTDEEEGRNIQSLGESGAWE